MADRIPTQEECYELMDRYAMLPNIAGHSIKVMHVSRAILDNLRSGVAVNRDAVIAASLLHDITKTRSLETHEWHDKSGGVLLRELGFNRIAEIVEQHVHIRHLNEQGDLEEREIVYYADKRVMHEKVVTIDERVQDLVVRYGITEEIRDLIRHNKGLMLVIERKIAGFMEVDIHEAIARL